MHGPTRYLPHHVTSRNGLENIPVHKSNHTRLYAIKTILVKNVFISNEEVGPKKKAKKKKKRERHQEEIKVTHCSLSVTRTLVTSQPAASTINEQFQRGPRDRLVARLRTKKEEEGEEKKVISAKK